MNDDLTRADKLRRTCAAKRARGDPTGRVPLGYMVRYDPYTGVGGVVEDPDVMPLMREARRMREEGHSLRTICRVMHSRGLRSRTGRRIAPGTMQLIL
jgi:hypothetical protein